MSEVLKHSKSKQLHKWYDQDQEKDDHQIIASNKKNLSTEWNQNRPAITKLYRTTLEDQANTQLFLIDRIIKRLDEVQNQNPDPYNYNGYLYNSPSHNGIVCWKGGNLKQNGISFTVHKPVENKIKNNKQIDLVRISPVSKVDKSKEMDYISKILADLDGPKKNQNGLNYKQTPQINPSIESLISGLSKKKSIKKIPELSKFINELNDSSNYFSPVQEKSSNEDKNLIQDISSIDEVIEYLKTNKPSVKIEEIDDKKTSPKKEPKRQSPKKETLSSLTTISELPVNIEEKNKFHEDLGVASAIPQPPPPPSLLLDRSKKTIEIVTSSGDEVGAAKLPENFLNEILESKKKLKHSEVEDKKVERDIGFIQELKDYLRKVKEPKNEQSELINIKKDNVEQEKENLVEENLFRKNLKKVKVSQETQTDFLPKSKSNSSSNLSKRSSKSSVLSRNSSSRVTSTPTKMKYEDEFKIKSIENVPFNSHSSPKSSHKITSSDRSFLHDDKFSFNKFDSSSKSEDDTKKKRSKNEKSKYVDKNTSPISYLQSSNSSIFPSLLDHKILISDDEKSLKEFKQDFILNIFHENFPELDKKKVPLVYQCHPQDTTSRLKNVLIKLYFDLEKYFYLSNKKELDLVVHPVGDSRAESADPSNFSFQKTESETFIGNLNQSNSNNTIASREQFFENLRQMIEESQDETDTDYQKSFQNLNEFYNNLLKKYQDKYRKNENVEVVSSAISEEGEHDSYDNYIQSSLNQFSDSSLLQSELSDVYKSEQKKIHNVPNTGLIVVDEISEENSSDTIFRPSISKKKVETESYEKMNISSGIDDRPLSKVPKLNRSRSRAETLSQENMNISSDSEDTILKPVLRKSSIKYKSRKNSNGMEKVYIEEEKKLSSQTLNKLPKNGSNSIWFDIEENEKDILRPKSVPVEEIKKVEKERPKSVVFSDNIFDSEKGEFEKNNSKNEKEEKEEEEKSLAQLWKEINKVEKEKKEKRREEIATNLHLKNIWKEARDVAKNRSQMQAYERISIEQRASELEKILEIDIDKKEEPESSDDYIDPKFNSSKLTRVIEASKAETNIEEPTKFQKLIQKFENPQNQNFKKQDMSFLNKSETANNKLKSLETSTTSTNDSPKETRIGGLLFSKDVKIDSGKKSQARNSLAEDNAEAKAFSLQANSFLNKLKNVDKKDTPIKSSLNVENEQSENEKKSLFTKNDNKFKRDKLFENELETRKSFALSENLPQVDEISRSSLNIQDETSKRSTINNLVDSDLSQSSEKLSSTGPKSNSDIDKYFQFEETSSPEIPPKIEKKQLRLSKKSEISRDSLNLSEEFQNRRSGSLFASTRISDNEDELENQTSPKVLNNSEERDSFILDKILLKKNKVDPDEEKYFKDRSNLNPNDSGKMELDETDKIIQVRKLKSHGSFRDSIASNYNTDIENDFVSVGPAPETMEIIRRLKQPSQSANVGIFGVERAGEKQRENKLSGGKQRKPNEETKTDENDFEYRRTKSSNSMNTNRYKIFSRLFNRDKSDTESNGSFGDGLKKKISNVKK